MARILIIEDDAGVRHLLEDILSMAGHQVAVAEDGSRGMRLYRKQTFDLVFTDLIMPDKDGLEVIKEVRQMKPEAKIIGMSGGGARFASTYLRLAHGLGASRLLAKPFMHADLIAMVEELLPPGAAPVSSPSFPG